MDSLFDMFIDLGSDCFLCNFLCYSGNVNRSTGHLFVSIESAALSIYQRNSKYLFT